MAVNPVCQVMIAMVILHPIVNMEYILKHWKIFLIGVLGVILGVLGNIYANKLSEDRIIKSITAEIESLKAKQQTARTTAQDQDRLAELEAQLKFLTNKN